MNFTHEQGHDRQDARQKSALGSATPCTSAGHHPGRLKSWAWQILLFAGGLLWISFSLGFLVLLSGYLMAGAGLQNFPSGLWQVGIPIFSTGLTTSGVFIGLVHVCGLFFAACISFVIGVTMCALGATPAGKENTARE